MLHELARWGGLTNASGGWYLFWSGICGDLIFLGAVGTVYRKLNCHVTGCHRLGLHHVRGTPYITCRKHHPDDDLTAAHVALRHSEASDREMS